MLVSSQNEKYAEEVKNPSYCVQEVPCVGCIWNVIYQNRKMLEGTDSISTLVHKRSYI